MSLSTTESFTGVWDFVTLTGTSGQTSIAETTMEDLTMSQTLWDTNAVVDGQLSDLEPATTLEIILLSCLFGAIGLTGLFGNCIVIYVIITKAAMRRTVTNLFILNLSIADALIMVLGVPDIVMFMMSRGWVLGLEMCKAQRYILVVSFYLSAMNLMTICIERYIATVHPFRAHILCSKKRAILIIFLMWLTAITVASPPLFFNDVRKAANNASVEYCIIIFPGNHHVSYMFYKYMEFFVFYMLPFLLQTILYVLIGRRLFANTKGLHQRKSCKNSKGKEIFRVSEALRGRRNVVKMLIICVIVYFISYSPFQVVLLYNTLSEEKFQPSWSFLVFLMTMAYINSAANPLLYSIFSQKFRREFAKMICTRNLAEGNHSRSTSQLHTLASPNTAHKMSLVGWRLQSYNTKKSSGPRENRRHSVM